MWVESTDRFLRRGPTGVEKQEITERDYLLFLAQQKNEEPKQSTQGFEIMI